MWAFIFEINIKKIILQAEILLCVPYGCNHMIGEADISLLHFTIAFINSITMAAQLIQWLGYGSDVRGFGVRFQEGVIYLYLRRFQMGRRVHKSSHQKGNRGSFSRGTSAVVWILPVTPPDVEVKNEWSYTSTAHLPSLQAPAQIEF